MQVYHFMYSLQLKQILQCFAFSYPQIDPYQRCTIQIPLLKTCLSSKSIPFNNYSPQLNSDSNPTGDEKPQTPILILESELHSFDPYTKQSVAK